VFDGIEVDQPALDADGKFWRTRATVYRKDMSRPFIYPGRYPAAGGNQRYNEEMCIKVAEVMTLRRAFDVAAPVIEERWSGDYEDDGVAEAPRSLADRIVERAAEVQDVPVELAAEPIDAAPVATAPVVEEVVVEPEPDVVLEALRAPQEAEPVEADVAPAQPTAAPPGLSYTEFMDLAKAYDREQVRATAKRLFPGESKFANLSPAQRQELLDDLAANFDATVEATPDEALFVGAPTGKAGQLCGEPSPFGGGTCTMDAGHPVPLADGASHRSGVREAW
jgi:hypothetical protein